MEIGWLTAFLDLPADRFDIGTAFWLQVTESVLSSPRGAEGEFATLVPPTGDAVVRVQRTTTPPRIHLDLHVDSVDRAREEAERSGATVDIDLGHVVMTSPGGFTFCLVSHLGESRRPEPAHRNVEHRLDQVCLDVPAVLYEREVKFWRTITSWPLRHGRLEEFSVLDHPPTIPLRLLFQRLGHDDGGETTRAHLDIACGPRVADVRRFHEFLGAEFVAQGPRWTTMRDPAGLLYCLTQRDVTSGKVAT